MNILIALFTEIVFMFVGLLAIAGFTKDSLVLLICFTVLVPIALGVVNFDKDKKTKE